MEEIEFIKAFLEAPEEIREKVKALLESQKEYQGEEKKENEHV